MTQQLEAVRRHTWAGYRCESRLVRAPAPRLAPVLLIGGAFQRKESWGRIEREMLAVMDVVTVDPPGWGAGGLLPDRHGPDVLADAVCHMLDETGLGAVHVFAGSYGTAIAYRLAQRHPGRVLRMALVGTMTSIPDHAREAMDRALGHLAARRMEEFARDTVAILMNLDRLADVAAGPRIRAFLLRRLLNLPEEEIEQAYANTRRLLERRMLDTARPPACPVLVVTGEHDHLTTPALSRELAATCPDSWFAEVAGADHMLYLERTAELADLATRFFGGDEVAGLPYCRRAERVRGGGPVAAVPGAGVPAPFRAAGIAVSPAGAGRRS